MIRALILLLLLVAGGLGAQQRPDIILIVTDDQPYHMLDFMPQTKAQIGDQGLRFQGAYVDSPLCCPSRAGILSGQHAHNHGVWNNGGIHGGADWFSDASTVATWLADAGYRTGLVGKYMNEYDLLRPFPYVPPGWKVWNAFVREKYTEYDLVEKGKVVHYGSTAAEYSTTVLGTKAVQFINKTPRTQPLFLFFGPFAPHFPARPAPRDVSTFPNLAPYRPPNHNEADVSDKPSWVRALPLLSPTQIDSVDTRVYKRMVQSLLEVDRAVARILYALQQKGRLANAVIVFTSDNGYSLGAHRWVRKSCPYEECVRVPLVIRAPGVGPRDVNRLVTNIDLAPTFAELAGVTPPAGVNGRSLVPLLAGPVDPALWRDAILFEYLGSTDPGRVWYAVRTEHHMYAEYDNGERELYDLLLDPFQLENVVDAPEYAAVALALSARLQQLKEE